jgi:hypothetical protein
MPRRIASTPFFTAVKRRPNDGALATGLEELIQTELARTLDACGARIVVSSSWRNA